MKKNDGLLGLAVGLVVLGATVYVVGYAFKKGASAGGK